MNLYLATRNPGKIKAAMSVFDTYGINVLPVDRDYPEIQAESSLEIAKFTALQVARDYQAPAVREDHSFFLEALGIPGPYMSFIEKKLPPEKLIKIVNLFQNNQGHFEVATVCAFPNGNTIEHVFSVPFTLGSEIKGEDSKGWSGLIRLHNETRAITEYPEEERLHIWNQGYKKIAQNLTK